MTTTTTASRTAARRAAPAVLLALGGALLGSGIAGTAAAATLIQSCPYTIVAPGTYVLDRDLTCPGGEPAITVAADRVRLDLGGNTLTGDGDPDTFGDGIVAEGTEANPTLEGLRIQNGAVAGFDSGVFVRDAPGARVAGVTATGNDRFGIRVYAPRARVEGNVAGDNGRDGIDLDGCDGCRVAGNRTDGNGDDGITLFGTAGARVEGNRATGNGEDGIELVGSSADNLIRGNTVTGNLASGIDVARDSAGNRIEGNRATGNDTNGDGDPDLVDLNLTADPPLCVNTWRANRFTTDSEGDGPGAGCIR